MVFGFPTAEFFGYLGLGVWAGLVITALIRVFQIKGHPPIRW